MTFSSFSTFFLFTSVHLLWLEVAKPLVLPGPQALLEAVDAAAVGGDALLDHEVDAVPEVGEGDHVRGATDPRVPQAGGVADLPHHARVAVVDDGHQLGA